MYGSGESGCKFLVGKSERRRPLWRHWSSLAGHVARMVEESVVLVLGRETGEKEKTVTSYG